VGLLLLVLLGGGVGIGRKVLVRARRWQSDLAASAAGSEAGEAAEEADAGEPEIELPEAAEDVESDEGEDEDEDEGDELEEEPPRRVLRMAGRARCPGASVVSAGGTESVPGCPPSSQGAPAPRSPQGGVSRK
jgi:hypothetical protein